MEAMDDKNSDLGASGRVICLTNQIRDFSSGPVRAAPLESVFIRRRHSGVQAPTVVLTGPTPRSFTYLCRSAVHQAKWVVWLFPYSILKCETLWDASTQDIYLWLVPWANRSHSGHIFSTVIHILFRPPGNKLDWANLSLEAQAAFLFCIHSNFAYLLNVFCLCKNSHTLFLNSFNITNNSVFMPKLNLSEDDFLAFAIFMHS